MRYLQKNTSIKSAQRVISQNTSIESAQRVIPVNTHQSLQLATEYTMTRAKLFVLLITPKTVHNFSKIENLRFG
jgi:hypothetical protein